MVYGATGTPVAPLPYAPYRPELVSPAAGLIASAGCRLADFARAASPMFIFR